MNIEAKKGSLKKNRKTRKIIYSPERSDETGRKGAMPDPRDNALATCAESHLKVGNAYLCHETASISPW